MGPPGNGGAAHGLSVRTLPLVTCCSRWRQRPTSILRFTSSRSPLGPHSRKEQEKYGVFLGKMMGEERTALVSEKPQDAVSQ